MPEKKVVTPYDELTYKIIGCAMAVHKNLGPGLREDTYQRALEAQLKLENISFEAQKLFEVFNEPEGSILVGYYIPDFIVEEKVVIEIKAVQKLDSNHLAQIIGYLAVTGFEIGLLINFAGPELDFRRIFPPEKIKEHKTNPRWLFVPEWLKKKQ